MTGRETDSRLFACLRSWGVAVDMLQRRHYRELGMGGGAFAGA